MIDPSELPQDLVPAEYQLVRGFMAEAIAETLGAEAEPAEIERYAPVIAALAHQKVHSGNAEGPPAPLYVRPPDAKPSNDPTPVILDA